MEKGGRVSGVAGWKWVMVEVVGFTVGWVSLLSVM